MNVVELIHKKRLGQSLSAAEIVELVKGYVSGDVEDYQMSAWAMAVCLNGMTDEEITALTLAIKESGDEIDLSGIRGITVDKHSTGGVADTTTLVLAPLVAAVGVPVAKMSGRGLGHTGGTIDKLESIPGLSTELDREEFLRQVGQIGIAVAGQTGNLAPADKKLYALRDVTDTVQSVPLIASSIMSKKLASGAKAIVLDVKVGNGAFMKTEEEARALAKTMVDIGLRANHPVTAVLTRMEEPLGRAIGNALEVREAILTLRGQGSETLRELCLVLGAEMVVLAGKAATPTESRTLLQEALDSGAALAKFKEFVAAQHGDARVADDLALLPKAPVVLPVRAEDNGTVQAIAAEDLGLIAMRLGAGRAHKDDTIDASVGLVLHRRVGQSVVRGELLAEIHARTEAAAREAERALRDCITVTSEAVFPPQLIIDVIRGQHHSAADDASVPLLKAATEARNRAYVPYSHFAVGAALQVDDGTVFTGANIENASYGLTNCAERTAVFRAVMEGLNSSSRALALAVVADSDGPVSPCGACRQVLSEFCPPDMPVYLGDTKGNQLVTTVRELLPYSFEANQMPKTD